MAGPRDRIRYRGREYYRKASGAIWTPANYANTTLLWDKTTSPYSGAGSITPDISTPGANPLALKFTGQPAADGGGILFPGDATKSGFENTGHEHAIADYLSALAGGAYRAGTIFAIVKPSSLITTAYDNVTPYNNDIFFGCMVTAVIGIGAVKNGVDIGIAGHVYDGTGGYLPFFQAVTPDAYHTVVLRWTAVAGAGGGHVDLSIDGGLSGSGTFQTNNVSMTQGVPDIYLNATVNGWIDIGFYYNAASNANQRFKGTVGLVGITSDVVSDAFITDLYSYGKAKFGVA